MTIQAIIFDFGGVLIEWDPRNLYRKHFKKPEDMERFLAEVNFSQWNLQFDRGVSFADGIASLSAQFPQYAAHIQRMGTNWAETLGDAIHGTVDILRELQQAGIPLYALSNWSAETFPIARRRFDFFDAFEEIVLSGDVKMIKPERGIFELVLQKIGRPAHDCLFIDDAQANIDQAIAMGFQTIHFTSSERLRDELLKMNLLPPS